MSEQPPKTAIVTGGASGLGLEIAQALHASGCTTVVFDRNPEALAQLPPCLTGYAVDVTVESEVADAVRRVQAWAGKIHFLVNNAGTIFNRPLVNLTEPDRRRHGYQ